MLLRLPDNNDEHPQNIPSELILRDEGLHALHKLRLPHVRAPGQQAQPGQDLRDCQGRRQHQVQVPHQSSSWSELYFCDVC